MAKSVPKSYYYIQMDVILLSLYIILISANGETVTFKTNTKKIVHEPKNEM